MSMATTNTPRGSHSQLLSREQVVQTARTDAETAYRELSGYEVSIVLEPDGWHVDYKLRDPLAAGGGPHYVIDPRSGAILRKRYEQ